MKRYTFELVIEEGSDEFWEEIGKRTGCDEVTKLVKDLIESDGGFHCDGNYQNCGLRLTRFDDDEIGL